MCRARSSHLLSKWCLVGRPKAPGLSRGWTLEAGSSCLKGPGACPGSHSIGCGVHVTTCQLLVCSSGSSRGAMWVSSLGSAAWGRQRAPPQRGAEQVGGWTGSPRHQSFPRRAAVWPGEAGPGCHSCTGCSSFCPQWVLPCCPLLFLAQGCTAWSPCPGSGRSWNFESLASSPCPTGSGS